MMIKDFGNELVLVKYQVLFTKFVVISICLPSCACRNGNYMLFYTGIDTFSFELQEIYMHGDFIVGCLEGNSKGL